MPLCVGDKLGHYEVLAPIGAGGMGEVYRARDTQLDRDAAIKVLPRALANDPDRLARFDREAKILAALNHPNIAVIYGLIEAEGQRALAMELVPGETLLDRVKRGPIPLDEILQIARQIAEALEAAHERGVIHRDLKPANVMITPTGLVKVLDFGLAAMTQPASAAAGDQSNSPTLTIGMTQAGVIMGTAAYMAPEQTAGMAVDRRADIWSYGVVLWEMLTRRQLFSGDTMAHTLADVLRAEIRFEQVAAPGAVKALLQRCLERDVKTRLQWIGEARVAITKYLANPKDANSPPADSLPYKQSRTPWLVAAFAAAAALGLAYISYRHVAEEEPRLMRVSVLPPDKGSFTSTSIPAISPDGRRIAFGATVDGKTSLWVRDLDALAARLLPGTEDAQYPFWSPDSRTVGFFAATKLKKIDVTGGPALTICDAAAGRGGAWAGDTIVFGLGNVGILYRVSAAGGAPTIFLKPDPALGETLLRWPSFLPDSRHFLYSANNGDPEKVAVYVADLVSKTHQRVLAAASNVVYVSPPGVREGQLLFVRDRTLMAQPFDLSKLQIAGDAVPIAEQVERGLNSLQNQFSASQNGTVVFKSGTTGGGLQLTWFDRSGKALGTIGPPAEMPSSGVISPDGSTVAFDRREGQSSATDIWLYDLARGTTTRFTFGPSGTNSRPVWAFDGTHIAFGSSREGVNRVFQRATNAGIDELLTPPLGNPPSATRPDDWSRDGRYLVETAGGANGDLWVQPLFGDKKQFPYLATPSVETQARLSPDGRWLAYASDESRRLEVYVQSFPTPGSKAQISVEGGNKPAWSRDGKELYFIGADRKMMAVSVKTGNRFEAGTPKALFDTRIGAGGGNEFDVSKDGRFLIPTQTESVVDSPLTVFVNWPILLKK